MKYTSILAGALGLMALAACTNNDEVKFEQPQLARTLTVTWGGSADTRLGLMFTEVDAPIKSYWEKNDEIGVAQSPGVNVITYKTTDETVSTKYTSTFNLVGDTGPVEGENYIVVYPKSYATEGFNFSQQTGLYKDLYKFVIAGVDGVTFTANEPDKKLTLEPMTSYLVIPEGTEFPELEDFLGSSECDDVYFTLAADELIVSANWSTTPPTEEGVITISKAEGETDNFVKMNDDGKFVAAEDIFIAVAAVESLSELVLTLRLPDSEAHEGFMVEYYIWKTMGETDSWATIERGHFYDLTGHLLFNSGGEY